MYHKRDTLYVIVKHFFSSTSCTGQIMRIFQLAWECMTSKIETRDM